MKGIPQNTKDLIQKMRSAEENTSRGLDHDNGGTRSCHRGFVQGVWISICICALVICTVSSVPLVHANSITIGCKLNKST